MIDGNLLSDIIYSTKSFTPEDTKEINEIYHKLQETEVNILFMGRTGVGKSSTINAFFGTKYAKTDSIKPCTDEIYIYDFKNLKIYDSPGLGESIEKDEKTKKEIFNLIQKKNGKDEGLIDLIFFVFDANSRDYSESYILINEFLSKLLDNSKRLILALNKIDLVEGGILYNTKENQPDPKLHDLMNEKIKFMKKNLKEDYDIIYYSAGINNNYIQLKPYNIISIYQQINDKLSLEKRIVIELNINEIKGNFEKGYIREKDNSWKSYFLDFFQGFFYGFGFGLGKSTVKILEIAGGIYAFLKIKSFLESDKGKEFIGKAKALRDNAKNIYNSIMDYNNEFHTPGFCNCQECQIKNAYEGYQFLKEETIKFSNYLYNLKYKK